MNVLNAIGNINKPEVRFLPDGTPILQFSFALNSGYGDKQVTTWLNCSLFGKRAEKLGDMISTGTRIGITGEIINRAYTTKEGVEKTSLECRLSDVTLLGKKDGESVSQQRQAPQSNDKESAWDESDDIGF